LAVSLAVLCYDWDGLGWLKGFLDERWVSTSFQTTHNWVAQNREMSQTTLVNHHISRLEKKSRNIMWGLLLWRKQILE